MDLAYPFRADPRRQIGTMQGSTAQPIAESFLALPLLVLVVPWGYAWRTYFAWPRRVIEARPTSAS